MDDIYLRNLHFKKSDALFFVVAFAEYNVTTPKELLTIFLKILKKIKIKNLGKWLAIGIKVLNFVFFCCFMVCFVDSHNFYMDPNLFSASGS